MEPSGRNKKKAIPLVVMIMGISLIAVGTIQKIISEDRLEQDGVYVLGKITGISYANYNHYIDYKFEVGAKLYHGSDKKRPGWPDRRREGKVVVGDYHLVKFNPENPNKSKIEIRPEPVGKRILTWFPRKVTGVVDSLSYLSSLPDLYIRYQVDDKLYRVRTRINPSDIGVSKLDPIGHEVELTVPRNYPAISNLFFESIDRRHDFD